MLPQGDEPSAGWDPRAHGIDITVPSVARVYDYLIGGKDNFAADRAVGDELMRISPDGRLTGVYHRAFLARGVRYLAEQGVRQFVDLGSGLPTANNTHQVAHAVAPGAAVVYVDNDPVVLAHGRALLADNPYTTVIQADMREPEAILSHPEFAKLIDLDQPVAWMLLGVVHHINDDERPAEFVDRYKATMAPGSHLFLSHFLRRPEDPRLAEAENVMQASLGSGRFRALEEIQGYFSGLEMVEPGVVPHAYWRPDEPVEGEPTASHLMVAGGIGRKA